MTGSMTLKKALPLLLISALACLTASCDRGAVGVREGGRMTVVASLFPSYDFARNVGRDRVDLSLLLPPGVEAHSFEPRPGDLVRLSRADVFIFTNRHMEPWVEKLLRGTGNRNLLVVDAGRGIALRGEGDGKGHGHGGERDGRDPHIWLDFSNAEKMVDNIRDGFAARDPGHRDFYRNHAEVYKAKLRDLDRQFQRTLAGCEKKVLVYGGHDAFGYLAGRYRLRYAAAYGFSPNAEPGPEDLVRLNGLLRKHGLKHIFHEEFVSPRVAAALAKEAGASLLPLHTGANIGKETPAEDASFIALMTKNLEHLKAGLQCP